MNTSRTVGRIKLGNNSSCPCPSSTSHSEKSMAVGRAPSQCLLSPTTTSLGKRKGASSWRRWWWTLPFQQQQQETRESDNKNNRIDRSLLHDTLHSAASTLRLASTSWVADHAVPMGITAATRRMAKATTLVDYALVVANLTAWLWLIVHALFQLILSSIRGGSAASHHRPPTKKPTTPQWVDIIEGLYPCWSSPPPPPLGQSNLIADALMGDDGIGALLSMSSSSSNHAVLELWEQHEQSLKVYRQAFPIRPTERRKHHKQQQQEHLRQQMAEGEENKQEGPLRRTNEHLINLAKEALDYFENAYCLSPDDHRDNMIHVLRAVL